MRRLVKLAAARGLAVISQKPMAPTLAEAESGSKPAARAGVPFFIHENWRWQAPLRAARGGPGRRAQIGAPFRARITMVSGFPVFANQPYLKDIEQFIIGDMGSQPLRPGALSLRRGENRSTAMRTGCMLSIRGEDVATAIMPHRGETRRAQGDLRPASSASRRTTWNATASPRPPLRRRRARLAGGRTRLLAAHRPRRIGHARAAARRRALPGPTLLTRSSTPAVRHATPTCCEHCAAKGQREYRPPRTT